MNVDRSIKEPDLVLSTTFALKIDFCLKLSFCIICKICNQFTLKMGIASARSDFDIVCKANNGT